ncbi:tRNA pseudouridine(55) synthase TruB [Okibacterium endophyticum]
MSSGILLIDKPSGITSHDIVARVRRLAGTRKVGHAGTLDPMATGLVIVGVNSSTRLLTYLVGQDKTYLATIRLGQSTSTDDAEGELASTAAEDAVAQVADDDIDAGVRELTGEIDQVPSSVSAIKVNGKRAYALVRAGEQVVLSARRVTISRFDVSRRIRGRGVIDLEVRIDCSSGTYIRALARDLGAGLGVGGHLTALRRTRIGPFSIDDAHEIESVEPALHLIGAAEAATAILPRADVSEQQATDLGHGKRIDSHRLPQLDGPLAAVSPTGRLVGVIELRNGQAKSIVNFPDAEAAAGRPGAQ